MAKITWSTMVEKYALCQMEWDTDEVDWDHTNPFEVGRQKAIWEVGVKMGYHAHMNSPASEDVTGQYQESPEKEEPTLQASAAEEIKSQLGATDVTTEPWDEKINPKQKAWQAKESASKFDF